ncbi:hypothetical protein EP232_01140 [bacterium]|nr:MAG: hypothetical protein EP232_01140 [bacterium]
MFPSRNSINFSLSLLILVFLLVTVCFSSIALADYIRIESSVLNVRQGPGTSYPVLFQAEAGDEFSLISIEGLWCHITLEDGGDAWVFRRFVNVIPGSIEGPALPPETVDDKSKSSGVVRLLIILMIFVLTVLAFLRRRQIARYTGLKMREMSGYRRDEPFRYDERAPDQDRWEL